MQPAPEQLQVALLPPLPGAVELARRQRPFLPVTIGVPVRLQARHSTPMVPTQSVVDVAQVHWYSGLVSQPAGV